MWSSFSAGFLELWSDEDMHKGQAYLRAIYPDAQGLEAAQAQYMRRLWQVTIRFRYTAAITTLECFGKIAQPRFVVGECACVRRFLPLRCFASQPA